MLIEGRHTLRQRLLEYARPREVYGHRDFAERFVRLGAGPYKGERFRCDRQPHTGLLLDELDRTDWVEIHIAGPSQSSKSLCGFVIPLIRDVYELRLDAVAGTPEADMFSDKWDVDIVPVLTASPELVGLIPAKGPGSKGGRIKDRVTLGNGVEIKLISRGGQDTAKAGFSAPRIRLTEAAGWSRKGEKSVEGGPFRQVRARLLAYSRDDPRRQLTCEGTFTIDDELPAIARGSDDDERFISTRSRLESPCPFCGGWIVPTRENLVGWQGAESELEVLDRATWSCPACGHAIDDEHRREALRDLRLVHAGQTINEAGEVVGERPPTSTLWFAWGGWHNLLVSAADIAVAEWEAAQIPEGTQEREDAERALCQFLHGQPFKSKLAEAEELKPADIRKKVDQYRRNVVPADTVTTTVGIDLGKYTGWPVTVSHRETGARHVPAYGAFTICTQRGDDVESRIVAALHEYADQVVEQGLPQEGTDGHVLPSVVWIDGGYKPDAVARFIRERGGVKQRRFWLARGRGRSVQGGGYVHPYKATTRRPLVGKRWFAELNPARRIVEITFDADYWKLAVAALLRAAPGRRGSLSLFLAETPNEHAQISHHFANEQLRKKWEHGRGVVEKWVRTGENHLLDAAAMALAAGDMAGFDLLNLPAEETAPAAEEKSTDQAGPSGFFATLLLGGKGDTNRR
jgi:phage terminase large subunit GpA-like protein